MPKTMIGPDTLDQMLQMRDHHLNEAKKIDDALAVFRDVARVAGKALALTEKVRARVTGIKRDRRQFGAKAIVEQHANFDAPAPMREIDRLMEIGESQGVASTRGAYSAAFYQVKKTGKTAAPTQPQLFDQNQTPHTTRSFALQHGNLKAPAFYGEARRLETLAKEQGITHLGAKAFENVLRRLRKEGAGKSKSAVKAAKRRQQKDGERPMDYVREVFRSTDGPLTRDQIVEQARLVERTNNPKFVNVSATKILEAMQRAKEIKKQGGGFVAWKLKANEASSNGAHA